MASQLCVLFVDTSRADVTIPLAVLLCCHDFLNVLCSGYVKYHPFFDFDVVPEVVFLDTVCCVFLPPSPCESLESVLFLLVGLYT